MLHAIGIKDSALCERCLIEIETIEHKFWHCKVVNEFWKNIARYINRLDIASSTVTFTPKNIIINVPEDIIMNRIISIAKSVISRGANLTIELFTFRLKNEISKERCMAFSHGGMSEFRKVWGKLENVLK